MRDPLIAAAIREWRAMSPIERVGEALGAILILGLPVIMLILLGSAS